MNKYLVSGSRYWRDDEQGRRLIVQTFDSIGWPKILVEGGQAGVDKICGDLARARGVDVRECPIDFLLDGFWPRAGTNRNTRMWETHHLPNEPIELVVCFPLSVSRGTFHMKGIADRAGVPTVVITPPQWYDDLCLDGRKHEVRP